jgi:hypothetical protein
MPDVKFSELSPKPNSSLVSDDSFIILDSTVPRGARLLVSELDQRYARGNYFGSGADGAVTIASNTTWETSTGTDDTGCIIKNFSSLTIDSSATVTANHRAQFMLVYVQGDCTINGTLSMSFKGAAATPATALAVQRLLPQFVSTESPSQTFTIPLVGAAGGAGSATGNHLPGANGVDGVNGQTGGGGGGSGGAGGSGVFGNGGNGAAGSCFCGGSGGGGGGYDGGIGTNGGNASGNGGSGGSAGSCASGWQSAAGAGNPVGIGVSGSTAPSGGGGGTLLLVVGGDLTIGSAGVISSDGAAGGVCGETAPCGAGAGGGSIAILWAGTLSNAGSVHANGGVGGSTVSDSNCTGGNGGNGSVQWGQVLAAA